MTFAYYSACYLFYDKNMGETRNTHRLIRLGRGQIYSMYQRSKGGILEKVMGTYTFLDSFHTKKKGKKYALQGNPTYVFLFWKLRGLSTNFHIHVFASDLYIPRIGPHICLQQNRQTNPGNIV
jgi:hypothetical protein